MWSAEFDHTSDEELFYTGNSDDYVRPDTLSGLFNVIGPEGNIRGKAAEGFVRPTIKQFFMSAPDYEEIESYTPPTGVDWNSRTAYSTSDASAGAAIFTHNDYIYKLGGIYGNGLFRYNYDGSGETNLGTPSYSLGYYNCWKDETSGYVYIFGQAGNMYKIPLNNLVPEAITLVGTGFPGTNGTSNMVESGGYLWFFGSITGAYTSSIYRVANNAADVTNPASWSSNLGAIPFAVSQTSNFEIIGNTCYMFGGHIDNDSISNVCSAPLSDLTSWTNHGLKLPQINSHASTIIIGDTIHMIGGISGFGSYGNAHGKRFSCPTSDPINGWTDEGAAIPGYTTSISNNLLESDDKLVLLSHYGNSNYSWDLTYD